MRRYGRFVDGLWIQHRMRLKDARVEQAAARAAARRQARLEAAMVAAITRLYPAGTDPAVIRAAAQAALQQAGGGQ